MNFEARGRADAGGTGPVSRQLSDHDGYNFLTDLRLPVPVGSVAAVSDGFKAWSAGAAARTARVSARASGRQDGRAQR